MNELEALELSIKLWQDIVDNNHVSKEQSQFFDKVKNMNGRCPLCQYYRSGYEKDYGDCTKCPLAKRKPCEFNDYPCFDDGEPYRQFCSTLHDNIHTGAKRLLSALKNYHSIYNLNYATGGIVNSVNGIVKVGK